eukprot:COSAG04_NODE_12168_length_667_cov_0.809859_2_plen_60_part_00
MAKLSDRLLAQAVAALEEMGVAEQVIRSFKQDCAVSDGVQDVASSSLTKPDDVQQGTVV